MTKLAFLRAASCMRNPGRVKRVHILRFSPPSGKNSEFALWQNINRTLYGPELF